MGKLFINKSKTLSLKMEQFLSIKHPNEKIGVYGRGYGSGSFITVEFNNVSPLRVEKISAELSQRFYTDDSFNIPDDRVNLIQFRTFFDELTYSKCFDLIHSYFAKNHPERQNEVGQICHAVLEGKSEEFDFLTSEFWGEGQATIEPKTLPEMLMHLLENECERFHRLCSLYFVEGMVVGSNNSDAPIHDRTVFGDVIVNYNHHGYNIEFEVPVLLNFNLINSQNPELSVDYRDAELYEAYRNLYNLDGVEFVAVDELKKIDKVVISLFRIDKVEHWQERILASYDYRAALELI